MRKSDPFTLTFDDGPGPSTNALLDVLAKHGCSATFFVLGKNLERIPQTAMRAVREGHRLGNHAYTHARPGELDASQFASELERTDALIVRTHELAGVSPPPFIPVRLPYGPEEHDVRTQVLAERGRSHVHWTQNFSDWRMEIADAPSLAHAMRAHVQAQTDAGLEAVLLLHDSSRRFDERAATVEAVRIFLNALR